jgi:hypothetical protein
MIKTKQTISMQKGDKFLRVRGKTHQKAQKIASVTRLKLLDIYDDAIEDYYKKIGITE